MGPVDFSDIWSALGGWIPSVLPITPTLSDDFMQKLSLCASYVSYFYPVHDFLVFFSALLKAIAGFYAVMAILRALKLIK